jgi:hypothetical protein
MNLIQNNTIASINTNILIFKMLIIEYINIKYYIFIKKYVFPVNISDLKFLNIFKTDPRDPQIL